MKLSKALVLKKTLVLGNRLAPAAPKPLLRWCKLREGLGVLHRPKHLLQGKPCHFEANPAAGFSLQEEPPTTRAR
jgi:hypothetical protein